MPPNGSRSRRRRRRSGPLATAPGEPMTDRSSRPHASPRRAARRLERRIVKLRFCRRWGPHRIATTSAFLARRSGGCWPATGCRCWPTSTRPPACRSANPSRSATKPPRPAIWCTSTSRSSAGSPTAAAGGPSAATSAQHRRPRQPATERPRRALAFAWLRLPAPRRRRPLPAGLLRAAPRRAQGDRRRVLEPRPCVLRRRRDHRPRRDDRQRLLLPLPRLRQALGDDVKHRRTRPYRPQTNGKVERFNRTLAAEWAYAAVYLSDAARAATYADWLHFYNHHRPHTGIGGLVPADRVHNVTTAAPSSVQTGPGP